MRTKHISLIFCGIQELFVLLAFVTFLVTMTGCNNNAGASTTNGTQSQQAYNITTNKSHLQKVLDEILQRPNVESGFVTGIPLAYQNNKNAPLIIASGKMSKESNAENLQQDAIFQVGSITKTFIGILSLKLAHEINPKTNQKYFGEKGLDSMVGDILGEQPSSQFWNKAWNRVTLRQLLNMTSGIPNYTEASQILMIMMNNPYDNFSINDGLSYVATESIQFNPGKGYYYSNTNYLIMGLVIAKVTDPENPYNLDSVQSQLKNKIFEKLQLNHTYFVENLPESSITRTWQQSLLMSGYLVADIPESLQTKYFYNGVDIKGYSLSLASTAGSIISNTSDVNKFIQAIFSQDSNFLTQDEKAELTNFVAMKDEGGYKAGEQIDALTTAVNKGFGLGYAASVIPTQDGTSEVIYFKPGGTTGFSSQWVYAKDKNISTVFTLNSVTNLRCNLQFEIINQAFNTAIDSCDMISD